ncbi:MAG: 23S rRNA (adenine(2503)-C(2))-methyltransferase RlmN [Candidatus Omnitrophica bacterium]|nr:23S rRNA (adenine(2503)-C(2))-methyltransferase RlmN [Candidatus Omnitrophota bacterium]
MNLKPSLYGFDLEEIKRLTVRENIPAYRGDQILEWLYKKHAASFDEARNLPTALRSRLAETYLFSSLTLTEAVPSANRQSTKFLFRTQESDILESVLISQQGRETVCVSTQLGCKIGCVFCASGKGKFGRNLSAGEIVEQVALIEKSLGKRVTNIVFMGMGEPLDNFEATMKALKILQEPWGFGIGARRITVSTSGITPRILEFVKRSEGRVRLSISLHSSQENKRTELVPINKRYSLHELNEALKKIHADLKREITFEYTVIAGVNDSKQEAEGVAKMAKPLNAKVNLIPYNPIREMEFKTPSGEVVDKFRDILKSHGIRVTVRQTAGRDINAACGQLRLDRQAAAQ